MPAMVGYLNHWATAAPKGTSEQIKKVADYLGYRAGSRDITRKDNFLKINSERCVSDSVLKSLRTYYLIQGEK
ncbi:hypothetical protein TNCV_1798971 [Trichonephila clavipes]|uniref:Uncharacterized protein n=1 Tax=Trichonephila clavipes TaxID=2585209 RepID=A0A8X6SJA8_TRICX|nr:hypothetical protein TNCV_1798971 [Trichonephila clavipes]